MCVSSRTGRGLTKKTHFVVGAAAVGFIIFLPPSRTLRIIGLLIAETLKKKEEENEEKKTFFSSFLSSFFCVGGGGTGEWLLQQKTVF